MASNDQINSIIQTHLNNGASQGWGHDDPRVLAAINSSFREHGVSNQQAASAWGNGTTADSIGGLLGSASWSNGSSASGAAPQSATTSAPQYTQQSAPQSSATPAVPTAQSGLSYGEQLHRDETKRLVDQQLKFAQDRGWGGHEDPRTLAHINASLYGQGFTNQDIANAYGLNAADVDKLFTGAGIDRSGVQTAIRAQAPGTGAPSKFAIGGSAPGSTITGGGAAGGSGIGGNGAGGSTGSGGSSSATTRPVDAATETIEGRVQNLLAVDAQGNYKNALVQQAREAAERQFAGRGLLNSSVSQEAAMQAAISKAIEIAGPDAQTYFSQGRANQDTLNTFKRDEIANNNDMAKLDKQLALEREKLTVQGSQFNQELAYKYDSLKLGQDSQIEAEKRAHQYALEIQNIDAVNAAYDLYLRRIQDIDMNKDLTAKNKQKMKNDAGKDFDTYAKAKGISWQMGLGDRFGSVDVNVVLPQDIVGGILNGGRVDTGS